MNELENIDDECEEKDISFVKTSDEGIDDEYDIDNMPALAFYRHKIRTMYTGNLMNEEEILQWVLDLYESKVDVIETVDRKTLQVLIRDNDHLAVLFCKTSLLFLFHSSPIYFPLFKHIQIPTTTVTNVIKCWKN